MDTKWKKSKAVLSFLAFALGITLVIGSLASAAGLLCTVGWEVLRPDADYQNTAEFRSYISDYLTGLLAAATGGNWRGYNDAAAVAYGLRIVTDRAVEATETLPNEAWYGGAGSGQTLEECMADLAQNGNIRFAVVYEQKLLYTNIEAFAQKVGLPWNQADFGEPIAEEEYNFTLWYNRDGEGRVQITKDGEAVDVYGSGTYAEDSAWLVPGYGNYTVDEKTKKAVVFLAVAREPRLYIVGNYGDEGVAQYGSALCSMQRRIDSGQAQLRESAAMLLAGGLLLALAFAWRRDKRRADRAVARLLGGVWLEVKIPAAVVLLAVLFLGAGQNYLYDLYWVLLYNGLIEISEINWYLGRAALNGPFLTGVFWVVYLAVLDGWTNRGRQKKPLLDSLCTRGLRLPIQQRLVRRGRWMALSALLALLAFEGAMVFALNSYYRGGAGWAAAMTLLAAAVALWLGVNLLALRRNRRLAEDIGALTAQIGAVRAGNLAQPLALPEDADLRRAAEDLNEIQAGLETALQEQMRSERMKVELVANVSHDLKTPLTAIISYIELLRQEEGLPRHVQEFIQILGEKAERLKTIVQDVFEISKAASGQLPVRPERIDLAKLLRQTLADMDGPVKNSGLTLRLALPEEPVPVEADGQRMYRVFQNLLQNALQYALEGSRVFLTLETAGETATVRVRNTSRVELDGAVDFTERFVRGDASRTDGGSGLGLSIAKSFTEACGGSFRVEVEADLFTALVQLPLAKAEPEPEKTK